MDITLQAIGTVQCTRREVKDDGWDAETTWIELTDGLDAEALAGLDTFSHVEVVFFMDRVKPTSVVRGARHPRNNRDWPLTGIFAQRGKNRPNQLGLTVCRVVRVDGRRLQVSGLDAVDGTPVLDIKPWVSDFGPRGEVRQPEWMDTLMTNYW